MRFTLPGAGLLIALGAAVGEGDLFHAADETSDPLLVACIRHEVIRHGEVQHDVGPILFRAAAAKSDDACRQDHGLTRVVGYKKNGGASLAPQVFDQPLHAGARSGIERAEGFIHQQNLGAHDERLRDGHALLHSARKLVRILHSVRFPQAHAAQIADSLSPKFLAARAPGRRETAENSDLGHFQPEGYVLEHGAVGEKRILLRHISAAAIRLPARAAFHQHLPAGRHFFGEHQPQ